MQDAGPYSGRNDSLPACLTLEAKPEVPGKHAESLKKLQSPHSTAMVGDSELVHGGTQPWPGRPSIGPPVLTHSPGPSGLSCRKASGPIGALH